MSAHDKVGLRSTRHYAATRVGYTRLALAHWQHVDNNDTSRPSTVGPIYRSESELLADHERYIAAAWLPLPRSEAADAMKDAADYLDCIPESAAGGDDEAGRIARRLRAAIAAGATS